MAPPSTTPIATQSRARPAPSLARTSSPLPRRTSNRSATAPSEASRTTLHLPRPRQPTFRSWTLPWSDLYIQVLAVLWGDERRDEYERKLAELLETRPCPRTLLEEVDFGDPAGDEDEVSVDDRADESGESFWEGGVLDSRE
ncbi:hypothetical protein L198_06450 [Cryptococcus wingfieldii CBS 7118]|uniref:Uncharacterized protein n=1 Tax=Cryptococcus wingfieldii CBS 7118 TaxID=1295528 RepID=A0A1E3IN54_9TREE|nr:hypothetical protein L198_06450 [Cryptococcus wingfieldii CBS 7118]ODN89131.1 hypothetical protein L198_06450 [Cryptococcus wingfieldii CBS 7118]